jgi:signal transduction histidine kinase
MGNGTAVIDREWQIPDRKGGMVWVQESKLPVHDHTGAVTGLVGIAMDVSRRKRRESREGQYRDRLEKMVSERTSSLTAANESLLREKAEREKVEAQFIQAQKMEAIGLLAGGVAHDFNNLLSVIIGYAQLGLQELEESSALHERLRQILEAGLRGSALTRQLLTFSRKQRIQKQDLCLNRIVENIVTMLGRLIGEHVTMRTDLAPNLPLVEADPTQIEQVLINATVNARDAMPGGGTICIATSTTTVSERSLAVKPFLELAGDYVIISVTDTGCGMDQDTLSHVFEPFFTTKPQGQGTGLGLATVYGIAKQHKGGITIESEVGKGTVISLYLPTTGQTQNINDESPSP